MAEIASRANELEITVYDTVQFFDCGANFERVLCPSCGLEITIDWWKDRMDEDYSDGFALAAFSTPCCGARCNLNQLIYEWPQRFGRFALSVLNAGIGKVSDRRLREFERILGCKLNVIYRLW